jgi:hypothetical protein
MKIITKTIFLLSFPLVVFAQSSNVKSITWNGKLIGEYIPGLHSNWNSTSLGAQIAFQYNINNDLFSSFIGNLYFIPTSSNNNFEYSSMRSLSLAFSYYRDININFDALFSLGLGYSQGKISNSLKKYPSFFSQLKFNYILNEKLTLFINFNSIYDISNKNFTPSFKIGYIADFIIISFDLLQFINWDNPASRLNNAFSVPNITNQSH